MRNSMKIAKWEVKRNMKNKTFIVGLFLTPIIIVAFMFIGTLFGDDTEEPEQTMVFVNDQLDIFPILQEAINQSGYNWEMHVTDIEESEVNAELDGSENTAYIFIDDRALETSTVPVYMSEEINQFFINQVQILESPIKTMQMAELGISDEELAIVSSSIVFEDASMEETATEETAPSDAESSTESLERMIPGAFAGFIMISIVFTGMAIFQSASQEKKDKIAEIILSSVTPAELMQGKIIGYFVLGIIQTIVSIVIVLPVLAWRIDFPIMEYLFVPELALLIGIAILGYLLFASIFVGIGATMSDISTAGNFQGLVMMLPFLPFVFIGPVLSDPSGLWAQIGTYVPFTSPGVLLLRLTVLEEWPWVEIAISLAILIVSIWIFMKLAGKIFKVGILMYGKNATPGEIWKWIRA
ncbi:ABC transporter permease [Oceanobacillus bengalensis]|uniref:ABC transporter permease n=2 Tax=Oceanobacillus bengalensis TaxID=1435466 RepID=A0A494Z0N1_9BACI|nr:ABC transporter permease [Oceanobacillus bengalensis]RKQ15838.1 ABC transporter permease [Oceanobacillus bengalensis]